MTACLIECPTCATRIPVDSETMRRVVSPAEQVDYVDELRDRIIDHCRDLSCTCNLEPA